MSSPVEAALRAWINARPIIGDGQPLSRGAYLRNQRSPADGAYAVIARTGGFGSPVAEDGTIVNAHFDCAVYAGTEGAAENAAAALRSEFETLTGGPQPCPGEDMTVLVADNHLGPIHIATPPEFHCYQVSADFLLIPNGG